jgi:hypothetical protein
MLHVLAILFFAKKTANYSSSTDVEAVGFDAGAAGVGSTFAAAA